MPTVPDYPTAFWFLACFSVVFVGIAKAGFGGGIAIIATPLIALAVPVVDAAAILLPLLIVCDVFAVIHYRNRFDRRSIKLLLPGSVLGIGVGAAFFGYFMDDERILQIGLGVLSVVFVLFQATRAVIFGALARRRPHAAEGVAMGAVSGFTSTLAHAGGPPVAIHLLPQQFPRDLYVGTTVIFFAVVNQIKLIPYFGLGLIQSGHLVTIAILAPLSYVGVRLGIFLNRRFSEIWFNRVVYTMLLLTGIQLILGKSLIAVVIG
ncbi:MAG: sulfite exporter TauE/SafE family protein [Candidatus Latescibacteria bacterium]|nr:sulfite exporter TauE/SafE family protein [Candidatus Latescibacterota bacterium]